jgi:hypothetical protein
VSYVANDILKSGALGPRTDDDFESRFGPVYIGPRSSKFLNLAFQLRERETEFVLEIGSYRGELLMSCNGKHWMRGGAFSFTLSSEQTSGYAASNMLSVLTDQQIALAERLP